MESETTTKKKIAPVWALIVVIIIAGILFLAFRPTNQADAPTIDTNGTVVATTTETTTPSEPAVTAPTTPSTAPTTPSTAPAGAPGVQVIQGDGFTATIRPVTDTGVAPTIKSFTVKQSTAGASCIFMWDTKDATSCEVINTTAKTSVRGVPAEGTLQTSDAGAYQLSCKGSGGAKTASELVSCN